jgi:chlorobactene glucosyltransferase
VGKVWACEQLAQAARGELLLYIDADVLMAPGAASRLSSLLDPGAAAVTVVPHQRAFGPVERSLMPLLHLSYVAWLFLPLVRWIPDPRVTAANGQVLLLRRAALAQIGGWSSVRTAVVDDMALCRRLKEQGLALCFSDGGAIASCLMYRSASALWRGFSKNLYPGIGGTPLALALVLLLHFACFVLPYLALLLAFSLWPSLLPAAGLAVGLNLLMRLAMALRFRHAPESILTHPIAVLGLMAIALNSWSWSRRGAIQWAGRSYPMAGP